MVHSTISPSLGRWLNAQWKRVNAGLEGEGTTERESEELQLEYKLVSSSQMKKHIQGFLKQHRGDWLNMVETEFAENNASN